jgi:hypothetical protein
MEFVSNMTRAQKEQYVIELYKQDKTIREIIQRVHMSPRDIGTLDIDDKSIRPVSSNMRLLRRNDTYKSIDSLADEVFDASADWVENHNNCL